MKPVTVFLSGLGFVLVIGGIYGVVETVNSNGTPADIVLPPDATLEDLVNALRSDMPSMVPSDAPSTVPSDAPSTLPSDMPSMMPSDMPSMMPSDMPSSLPSDLPSSLPSDMPSSQPSEVPSAAPNMHSDYPSLVPNPWEEDVETVGRAQLDSMCPCFDYADIDNISVPKTQEERVSIGYCFPEAMILRIADIHRAFFLNDEAMTCGTEVEIGIGQYREEIMPMTETALEACARLIEMRCEEVGYSISL